MKHDDERCTLSDIGMEVTGEDAPPVVAALNSYLAVFAKPDEKWRCLKCGTVQSGLMGALFGGFTWGLAHGEGSCSTCGWPARAYHWPKNADGEQIFDRRLEFVLQYHPDNVKERSSDD